MRSFLPSLPLFVLLFSSCHSANIDVIQTGPWYKAKKTSAVEVFPDRSKVKKPFGGIAILHSERFRFSEKAVAANLKKARKEAAKMGADAVIYAVEYSDKNAPLGERPECYLTSLAIKYVDPDEPK